MFINDYQDFVDGIRLPSANHAYALYGLAGEVGELLSVEAKEERDGPGSPLYTKDNLKKELGDILWFVAALASDYGLKLSDVAAANSAKLASRRDRGVLGGSGDNR